LRRYRAQASEIVIDRALVGRVEILADIDSQYPAALRSVARSRYAGEEALHAFVVEAETVDQRARFGQTKQAWLRVARLWPRRDRSAFDETETQGSQSIDVRSVLIEPSGQAYAVGKLEAHHFDGRCRHARRDELRDTPSRCRVQARQRHIVRDLGIEREEQWAEQRIE